MDSAIALTKADGVAGIRFNRPDRLNAINLAMSDAFLAAVEEVIADEDIRVVILSGEGRAFVSGGDLAFLRDAPDLPSAARSLITPMHEGLKRLRRAGIPVVVAAKGAVAGAGMSLVLMADFVVAADDAVFNMAYMKVAATPDCGGSWALPRLVGRRRALELTLLSESVPAVAALELGLVNRLARVDEIDTASEKLARQLATAPAGAVRRTLALIDQAFSTELDEHLDMECQAFQEAAGEPDFAEALDAFFERRKPQFASRRLGLSRA